MNVNLIWDADGTLIDSYDSIIDSINKTVERYNLSFDRNNIRDTIQNTSTGSFLEEIGKKYHLNFKELWDFYNSVKIDYSKIKLMPNVKEVLEELNSKGINNYIYTHRGDSLYRILEILDIDKYFVEVVGKNNCFKRKPSPEAINYLINKYQLDKENTYYVGDRLIDQESARNAGIGAIYYQSYKGITLDSKDYDYRIDDLNELLELDIFAVKQKQY